MGADQQRIVSNSKKGIVPIGLFKNKNESSKELESKTKEGNTTDLWLVTSRSGTEINLKFDTIGSQKKRMFVQGQRTNTRILYLVVHICNPQIKLNAQREHLKKNA